MNSEDDTYKKLMKFTFQELIHDKCRISVDSETDELREKYWLESRGWTQEEYHNECKKQSELWWNSNL